MKDEVQSICRVAIWLASAGLAVSIWAAAFLFATLPSVAQAADAQVCTPTQMRHLNLAENHAAMCFETSRVLGALVQNSGFICNGVVGSIMDPADHKFFVTCLVQDFIGRADRVNYYVNYASVDGSLFFPVP